MSTSLADLRRQQRLLHSSTAAALLLGVLALAVLSLCVGDQWLAPGEVVAALAGDVPGTSFLVGELRAPRTLGATVAGFGLGIAGAVTQSVLRNPLASPDIIGVTAGASAAVVAVVAGASTFTLSAVGGSVAAAAVAGGLLAAAMVLLVSWSRTGGRSRLHPGRIVLVGLGVNAGLGSLSYWLLLRADTPDLTAALIWLAGSLTETYLSVVVPAGLVVTVCTVLVVTGNRWLDLLRLDDVTASSLGVRPARAQVALVTVAVVAASAATAVGGPIAFVAFASPQLAWRITRSATPGPLTSGLVGAAIVLAADVVARWLLPVNLPVGLVTALCGGPFLLWLLTRRLR